MATRKNHAYYLSRPMLTADEVGEAFIMDGLRAIKAHRGLKPYAQFTAEEKQELTRRIPQNQLDLYEKYFFFYNRLAETPNFYSECFYTAQADFWHLRHILQGERNKKQGVEVVKKRRRVDELKTLEQIENEHVFWECVDDWENRPASQMIPDCKESIKQQYRLMFAFHAFLSIIGPRGFLKVKGEEFADCIKYLYPRVDNHFISVVNTDLWVTHDFLTGKETEEPQEIDDPVYKWIFIDELQPEQARLDTVADNYNTSWFFTNQAFCQVVFFIAGMSDDLIQP